MIYLFLATGFEDIEALSPVDILRRAGLRVETVSITGHLPNGYFRMGSLDAGSYSTATTVNGVKTIGVEVMRHSA